MVVSVNSQNINDGLSVDPGVPNRPVRFKLNIRTENPTSWVSQNLPASKAKGLLDHRM